MTVAASSGARAPAGHGRPWWWSGPRTVAAVAATGILVGGLTLLDGEFLPATWAEGGNSFATWCLLAYLAGRLAPQRMGRSMALGVLALVCLVVGYYATLVLGLHRGDFPLRVMFWCAATVPAGAVFGALGWLRWTRSPWGAAAGSALVGALFGAELWATGWARISGPVGVSWAALGLLVTVVTSGGGRRRVLAVAIYPLALVGTVAGLRVVLRVFLGIA